jgi:hypothetical protein
MTDTTKPDWLVPAGLLSLSAVPAVAGAVRVIELGGGTDIDRLHGRRVVDQRFRGGMVDPACRRNSGRLTANCAIAGAGKS